MTKDRGATTRGERTHYGNRRRCRRSGALARSDVDLHVTMILCELTRSRESGADEEQGAQVAEHDDVCPVGDERDNREARREWPTLAVRLAGRKFLIRTPEIPHFRIVPEISGVYLLKLRL